MNIKPFSAIGKSGKIYPVTVSERTRPDDMEYGVYAKIDIDNTLYEGMLVIENDIPSIHIRDRKAIAALGIDPAFSRVLIALDRDFRQDFIEAGLMASVSQEEVNLLNLFLSRCRILNETEHNHLTSWHKDNNLVCEHFNRKTEFGHFEGARLAILHYFFGSGGNSSHRVIEETVKVPANLMGNHDGLTTTRSAVKSNHSYWYGPVKGAIGTLYVSPSMWVADQIKLNVESTLIENGAMTGDGDGGTWRENGFNVQYIFDPKRDEDLLLAILHSIQPPVDLKVNIAAHIETVNRQLHTEYMNSPLAEILPMSYEEWTQSYLNYESPVREQMLSMKWKSSRSGIPFPKLPVNFAYGDHNDFDLHLTASYSINHMKLVVTLTDNKTGESGDYRNFYSDGYIADWDQEWLKNMREFRRQADSLLRQWYNPEK